MDQTNPPGYRKPFKFKIVPSRGGGYDIKMQVLAPVGSKRTTTWVKHGWYASELTASQEMQKLIEK